MLVATVSEAKNGLSALLDRVRAGESVLILDRGIPVARLESAVSGAHDEAGGRIARLQRSGTVRATRSQSHAELLSRRPPRPRKGASALNALLEERDEGR